MPKVCLKLRQRGGAFLLAIMLLGLALLGACGDSAATPVPPSPTTGVVAISSPVPTIAAPTTAVSISAVPTATAVIRASTTTAATTSRAAATTAATTTRAATATPAANAPTVTPESVNGQPAAAVTPPPLGVSESILKATGFSGDSAKTFLNELTALGVRQVGTDGENKAADYLESKYRSFGYTQIERQSFPFPLRSQQGGNGTGHNLIVTRPGSKPDAPILVFGSHYDTVANTVGASDNGSGTVTTLELGRVLFKRFPDYELRFISFSGEEIGLIGSFYYASKLSPAEKKRVIAFLDIDAVGVGDRLVAVGTPELVNQAVDIAGQNGIRLEPFSLAGTGADSDQTSFIRTGLKAILIARWIDPQLHRPGDIPQRVFPEALLQAGGISILLAQKLTGSQ